MAYNAYQSTQFFPQPQGNAFVINNSIEMANIPMSSNLSVILCPSEELMYVKTLQGSTPTVMAYKISPFVTKTENNNDLKNEVEALKKQISEISKKIGGKFDDLL